MNKRILEVNVGIDKLEIVSSKDLTQADKNTNFIKLNFDDTVELDNWDMIVLYKTPYPTEILADTFSKLTELTEIAIPNEALKRNGKLQVEIIFRKQDKTITINNFLDIDIKRTINGTYLNADLGQATQQTIVEQLQAIQTLINQADEKIIQYNDNVQLKTDEFNKNYNNKIENLDVTVREFVEANKEQLRGPQGVPGANGKDGLQGPQGIQGPQGLQGPQGIAGTTDYNNLTNKPNLDDFYSKNQLFSTTKSELAIQLKSKNNQAQYEEWLKNGVRKIIYGFDTSNSNDKFVLNGYNNTFLELNGFASITMRTNYVDLGKELRMGIGQNFVNFSPDGNGNKALRFFNNAIGTNAYFNLETLGTLVLDTTDSNNNRSYDISFRRKGDERGQVGATNGKVFLWNKKSNNSIELNDNGTVRIESSNLKTASKDMVGAINELLDRVKALEGV